jgi:hypothetical protein
MVLQAQKTPLNKIWKLKTLFLWKKTGEPGIQIGETDESLSRDDGTARKELDNMESETLIIASCRKRTDGEERQELADEEIEKWTLSVVAIFSPRELRAPLSARSEWASRFGFFRRRSTAGGFPAWA